MSSGGFHAWKAKHDGTTVSDAKRLDALEDHRCPEPRVGDIQIPFRQIPFRQIPFRQFPLRKLAGGQFGRYPEMTDAGIGDLARLEDPVAHNATGAVPLQSGE